MKYFYYKKLNKFISGDFYFVYIKEQTFTWLQTINRISQFKEIIIIFMNKTLEHNLFLLLINLSDTLFNKVLKILNIYFFNDKNLK